VDKKNQLDVAFCILYFSSDSCSTCFGQPCAHHQELTTAWCYRFVLVCAVVAGRLSRPAGRYPVQKKWNQITEQHNARYIRCHTAITPGSLGGWYQRYRGSTASIFMVSFELEHGDSMFPPKPSVLTYQTTWCHGLERNNLITSSHDHVNMQAQSTSKPTARQGSSVIPNCYE